jgi:hypothetical protein
LYAFQPISIEVIGKMYQEKDFARVAARKHARHQDAALVGDLVIGGSIYHAGVHDFSPVGVRLTGLQENTIPTSTYTCTIFLSKGSTHFKLLVKPCWKRSSPAGDSVEMGFKILDSPWQWYRFSQNPALPAILN